MADTVGIGAEARIGDQFFPPDRSQQLLGHALRRGREADPAAILRAIGVARHRIGAAAAGPRLELAGQRVIRVLRLHHHVDGIEEALVDHLALPRRFRVAQRDHRGGGAVETRIAIGHVHRRQHRLAVGEAVHRGEAGIAFDERAEAGLVAVRPVLAPAADAHDDERRVDRAQGFGREAHGFQHAGTEALAEDRGIRDQALHHRDRLGVAQIETGGELVATERLPGGRDALDPPGSQRVAFRRLNLDHLGAVVGQHLGQDVPGDEAREIDHAEALEGAGGGGVEGAAAPGRGGTHSALILAAAATARQRARSLRRISVKTSGGAGAGVAPSAS